LSRPIKRYWDCKGHAGVILTFGEGAVLNYSWKVKMNRQSLTKMELVGVDVSMPEIRWFLSYRAKGTTLNASDSIRTIRAQKPNLFRQVFFQQR
jgi:hypothetical protein